ncbi:choice-of-anchor Q domain-containing protein [Dokdonella soli]
MPRLTPIASALAAALALASPMALAIQTVTTCADSGIGSLRAAITNAAITGDTVTFNTATMSCSTITLTTGALTVNATSLTVAGPGASTLTIDANHASRIFDHEGSGTLNISNLTVTNGFINSGKPNGGCIYSKGTVAISSSRLSGCVAQTEGTPPHAFGGGIFTTGDLYLQSSTISNSSVRRQSRAEGAGGGAFVTGNLVMQSSTVTSSVATFGGALQVKRNATIVGTTLSGNQAFAGDGLALYSSHDRVSIINSTISGNVAEVCAGMYSGGVFYGGPTYVAVTLSNSTIAFNKTHAANEVGHNYASGLCAAGSLNIQSSIVANNDIVVGTAHTPVDFSAQTGTSIAGGNNLIMVTQAGTTSPAGTLTADPLLAALANNGGSTMTHSLLIGSPAIGAGNNTSRLPSDQRGPGFARMTREKTDIGAFQTGDGIFASGFD